jgi:hypothetical protein
MLLVAMLPELVIVELAPPDMIPYPVSPLVVMVPEFVMAALELRA